MRRPWFGALLPHGAAGCRPSRYSLLAVTMAGILVATGYAMRDSVEAQMHAPAAAPTEPQPVPTASAGQLIAFSETFHTENQTVQQLVIVDAQAKSIGVYHVDPRTGDIELRCVRDIQEDMRIKEFNGKSPLPSEIRDMLNRLDATKY